MSGLSENNPLPKDAIACDPELLAELEAPENRRLREFYNYWTGKRDDATAIPTREVIDPIEIPELLPYIFLADVVEEEGQVRFRFRLIGAEIVERLQKNSTGKYMEDVNPDPESALRRHYDDAFHNRRYYIRHDSAYWLSKEHVDYRILLLPLSPDNQTITQLVALMSFGDG